jgi:hypothetical protein
MKMGHHSAKSQGPRWPLYPPGSPCPASTSCPSCGHCLECVSLTRTPLLAPKSCSIQWVLSPQVEPQNLPGGPPTRHCCSWQLVVWQLTEYCQGDSEYGLRICPAGLHIAQSGRGSDPDQIMALGTTNPWSMVGPCHSTPIQAVCQPRKRDGATKNNPPHV